MSYADQYRDRRRRQRREGVRWVAYLIRTVVTSATILIVSFALDIPEKLRQKVTAWRQSGDTQAQAATPDAKIPEPRPSEPTSPAGPRNGAGRNPNARHPTRPPANQSVAPPPAAPAQPQAPLQDVPNRPQPERSPAREPGGLDSFREPAAIESAQAFVALDMTKRRTIHPLDELFDRIGGEPQIKVVALEGPDLRNEIDRSDGIVHAGQALNVLFPEHPYVRLHFSVSRTADRLSLEIAPQMALGSDRPEPFRLVSIGRKQREVRGRFERMSAQLSQFRQEKETLDTWLSTRSPKTLQARRDAQTRVVVLGKEIPKMASAVESAEKDADTVDAIAQLANRLHNDAKIQIELIDPRAR